MAACGGSGGPDAPAGDGSVIGASGSGGAAVDGAAGSAATAQFRGGARHLGVYEGADFSHLGGVAWSVCTGGTVRSSAAVADGVVYVGGGDGELRALDLATGAERWHYDAGSPIASSPAVTGIRTAAGRDALVIAVSRDGVVHAVRAADGREAWTLKTGPDRPMPWGQEGWDYFVASPTLPGDGTALIAAGDGVLRRVALATGEVLGETDLGTRLRSSAAWADGRAYVGGADGVVYAIDAAADSVVWRHETEGTTLNSAEFGYDRRTVQASPVVADGRVYVGSRDGHLYALDAATGERLWRATYAPSWVVSSPVVHGGAVYTGTSDGLLVQAVDAATGQPRWTRELGTRILGSPALVGDVLLVPGNDGVLTALAADTGDPLWRFRAGAMIQASPVVAGDLVVFGDDAGLVHALRAGTATPRLAVFRDSALTAYETRPGAARLADELARAGYRVLDADALATFLADRIDDGAPSVVVFAQDHVPDAGLLRRYLDAGGKVVWLGLPPRVLVRDDDGRPTASEPARATAIAGVDFTGATGSDIGARPTAAGQRWGLARVHLSAYAPVAAPDDVTVLARDELGQPAAFVRSFGGPEGTGFVYLWGRGYQPDMLAEIRHAAEHGVLTDATAPPRPLDGCPATPVG